MFSTAVQSPRIPSKATDVYWIVQTSNRLSCSNDFTGKWCIILPPAEIDAAWVKIRDAVKAGSLPMAMVSTHGAGVVIGLKTHVICVFTNDYRDKADLDAVRETLRGFGFATPLKYKRDIDTMENVTGPKEFIYES